MKHIKDLGYDKGSIYRSNMVSRRVFCSVVWCLQTLYPFKIRTGEEKDLVTHDCSCCAIMSFIT